MAAGEPDLTLDEIDALIDASPSSKILIVAHWTWFLIQDSGRHLKIRNNGGLNYRGLDVWISSRTRMGTETEADFLAEA
ncbi:hypothetical protein [uncultured Brevundimonas sp.]|uniref:hypothetical protein n=1 Tax=uncultured Brevundimonas sp. TaxID=213418 RepID=UPI0025E43C05|nr:hypothetical protein [uncultured Brevundimonas sp.]